MLDRFVEPMRIRRYLSACRYAVPSVTVEGHEERMAAHTARVQAHEERFAATQRALTAQSREAVELTCATCGHTFRLLPSVMRHRLRKSRYKRLFCSYSCGARMTAAVCRRTEETEPQEVRNG